MEVNLGETVQVYVFVFRILKVDATNNRALYAIFSFIHRRVAQIDIYIQFVNLTALIP